MLSTYDIRPISRQQIDIAYPLAALVLPALTIEEWRSLCRASGEADEIALASNATGYAQGLSISSVLEQEGRRILDVSGFVVVSAADEPGVQSELIEFLKKRARARNCSTIQIHLAEREAGSFAGDRLSRETGASILTIAL